MIDIDKSWRRFLQDTELSKNYHLPYLLDGGIAAKNPLLEYLLPSLLYIKLGTILDEALASFIDYQQLNMPNFYGGTLNGRIDFLADCGLLAKAGLLHEIREIRNLLAHETNEKVTWERLESDLTVVEDELRLLGFVGDRPNYEYFGERDQAQESEEPGIAFFQDYRYGLRLDGQVVMEIAFTKKFHQ